MTRSARAEQILAVAARLFAERGYDGVGVDEIGAAAGISGGAVYRHYRGKQHLLAAVVERMLERINESLATCADPTLEELVGLTVGFLLDDPDLMSAYLGSSRSLPPEVGQRVRAQQSRLAAHWHSALGARVPEVSSGEARYRAASVTGVAIEAAKRTRRMSAEERALLQGLMLSAATAGPRRVPLPPSRAEVQGPSGRRGQLLHAGIALFREQGFPGVSVEAIAGSVGIDQSSVYRHFSGKDELLLAGLDLAQRRLDAAATTVTAAGLPGAEQLALLVASYVDTALRNRDLLAVWLTESGHLDAETRRRIARQQRAYRDLWVSALQDAYPRLDKARATTGVGAAFALLSTGASLRGTPSLSVARVRELLQGMALACLEATGH